MISKRPNIQYDRFFYESLFHSFSCIFVYLFFFCVKVRALPGIRAIFNLFNFLQRFCTERYSNEYRIENKIHYVCIRLRYLFRGGFQQSPSQKHPKFRQKIQVFFRIPQQYLHFYIYAIIRTQQSVPVSQHKIASITEFFSQTKRLCV